MNYTQLVAEIQNYTENVFETSDIDTFIQQAEQRIYNMVQLPALRKNVTGTTTSGNKYLAIPTDWLSTFSLAVINANTARQRVSAGDPGSKAINRHGEKTMRGYGAATKGIKTRGPMA